MNPIRIEVRSERSTYPVLVGSGVLDGLGELLRAHGLARDLAIVSCPPVWRFHGRRLRGLAGGNNPPTLIPDGERAKTLQTIARLYDAFLRRGLDRSSTIVAFGGGVVGDVAGFAAATFLRGLPFVQVPTTVLAQVDSAIGGKVGVNLASGKNLAGAFHPPSLVVCDPDVLATLPRREFRAGLYEVVKYGVIASKPLFETVSSNLKTLFAHDSEVLTPLVADCCRIKAEVVSADERESGPRRTLNFGHTIGHALEAVTKYRRFRHGEAIAYGMLAAARISAARGTMSEDDEARLKDLIVRMGPLPVVTDLRMSDTLDAVQHDKKVVDGKLHFVLANGLGATSIVSDMTTMELKTALKAIGLKR
ncbi:MAG TPA: 3-dehydroquinate synthase [Vicinamibacterales bacterium]|nr:3-dehydroquinate synthase [Vicinamibacterales bacterium]